uniref:Chaperone protein DnaJ n=1 Tax=Anthurium amnicola TaxID=1678845 RepID=A0A1D1Z9I3_9ARAE
MEISIRTPSPASCPAAASLFPRVPRSRVGAGAQSRGFSPGRSVSLRSTTRIISGSIGDLQRCKSNLESLYCYDKSVPEETIEKPIGLSLSTKQIGNNPACIHCQAKGAVLCATCSGSGLYIDSILESQGIIVKVRCLGCGGTGNILCSGCGGRGHL